MLLAIESLECYRDLIVTQAITGGRPNEASHTTLGRLPIISDTGFQLARILPVSGFIVGKANLHKHAPLEVYPTIDNDISRSIYYRKYGKKISLKSLNTQTL